MATNTDAQPEMVAVLIPTGQLRWKRTSRYDPNAVQAADLSSNYVVLQQGFRKPDSSLTVWRDVPIIGDNHGEV